MDRRSWLKTGALFTGSLALLPGLGVMAAKAAPFNVPAGPLSLSALRADAGIAHAAPPELKARLFFNENPFGPSEKARQAIQDAIAKSYQYPFMEIRTLQGKIAAYEGIAPEQVLLSAGSSPLLLAAAIQYCGQPAASVISGATTYDALPGYAEKLGAK